MSDALEKPAQNYDLVFKNSDKWWLDDNINFVNVTPETKSFLEILPAVDVFDLHKEVSRHDTAAG